MSEKNTIINLPIKVWLGSLYHGHTHTDKRSTPLAGRSVAHSHGGRQVISRGGRRELRNGYRQGRQAGKAMRNRAGAGEGQGRKAIGTQWWIQVCNPIHSD